MATTALVQTSERYANIVTLLSSSNPTIGTAAVVESFTAPAGFGDFMILEMRVKGAGGTLNTLGTLAADMLVVTPALAQVDYIGTSRFWQISTDVMAAWAKPDQAPIVRMGELILVEAPALFSAGAGSVLQVMLKAKRLATP